MFPPLLVSLLPDLPGCPGHRRRLALLERGGVGPGGRLPAHPEHDRNCEPARQPGQSGGGPDQETGWVRAVNLAAWLNIWLGAVHFYTRGFNF